MSCHGTFSRARDVARLELARSRTSSTCEGMRRRGRADLLDRTRRNCDERLPSAFQLVQPPASRPPRRTAGASPTAAASAPARRPSSSSRPTNTICPAAAASPGELGAEAAAVKRNRDRSRHVPLGELDVGADVDDQCALMLAPARPRAGKSRASSIPSVSSGPWLSSTIALKLGGWAPSLATDASTNSCSSSIASISLWWRSKPIVEATLRSIPGPPHIEPPR